jgi:hypothetical protein
MKIPWPWKRTSSAGAIVFLSKSSLRKYNYLVSFIRRVERLIHSMQQGQLVLDWLYPYLEGRAFHAVQPVDAELPRRVAAFDFVRGNDA